MNSHLQKYIVNLHLEFFTVWCQLFSQTAIVFFTRLSPCPMFATGLAVAHLRLDCESKQHPGPHNTHTSANFMSGPQLKPLVGHLHTFNGGHKRWWPRSSQLIVCTFRGSWRETLVSVAGFNELGAEWLRFSSVRRRVG